jgi:acyl-[acyl-carrier-protein]-phospholipid O-acyltransferase/long-chain-fatty-acid--[acyl-carrier-protein] ligase
MTTMTDLAAQPTPLYRDVLRSCRHRRRTTKVVDSTGAELTGGMLLARSFVLQRLLRRHVLTDDERYVGIMLPPSAAAVAANLAVTFDKRIAVNLNYTLTSNILNSCLAQTEITHILTSRALLEKMPLKLDVEMVFLEDLRDRPTRLDKLIGAFLAFVMPIWLLLRLFGLQRVANSDVMAVIFTSGSTGTPKGVELTFGNVASNIAAIIDVLHIHPHDVMIGVLPFFHAFGYTVTLWTMLSVDTAAAFHVNPLDARSVAKLCRERKGTILLVTPMFLRGYIGRCDPADFATLEVLITGAEKLPKPVADAFEARFGIRPIEGYGCTEMSPFVAANVPPSRAVGDQRFASREGTVGKPSPAVRVKVIDPETDQELGVDEQGMLWVQGPNVMKGYLGNPAATARVIQDGWYRTGDIVTIDADGFIHIVGRESRFAKIGGEMVPHGVVEEALTEIIGVDEQGGQKAVVVSAPDMAKGERLVVVHTPLSMTPAEIRSALAHSGLPKLYIPATDGFVLVEQLPIVGTGKLDLRAINAIAITATRARDVSVRG